MDSSTPTTTAQRFVVSKDGHTVIDSKTGLTWQRNHLPRMTWSEAIEAADQANIANQFSHSDWRVPNKEELKSLIDLTPSTGPTIDHTAFPNFPASWFWTSNSYTPYPAFAWCVHFHYRFTVFSNKPLNGFVRLVRSGQ